jgi:hypothetical protein
MGEERRIKGERTEGMMGRGRKGIKGREEKG